MLGNREALWTLWEVSRAGTHAAAAARLGITASAVGQQLKALEQRLGVALFERVGRRSRLTPSGAALIDQTGTPTSPGVPGAPPRANLTRL